MQEIELDCTWNTCIRRRELKAHLSTLLDLRIAMRTHIWQ